MHKELGKIKRAEFGLIPDYPWYLGLRLYFSMETGCVGDGGKYTTNISEKCNHKEAQKEDMIRIMNFTNKILKDAKVYNVSDLVNKPVEITLNGNTFEDFRILTEVL